MTQFLRIKRFLHEYFNVLGGCEVVLSVGVRLEYLICWAGCALAAETTNLHAIHSWQRTCSALNDASQVRVSTNAEEDWSDSKQKGFCDNACCSMSVSSPDLLLVGKVKVVPHLDALPDLGVSDTLPEFYRMHDDILPTAALPTLPFFDAWVQGEH